MRWLTYSAVLCLATAVCAEFTTEYTSQLVPRHISVGEFMELPFETVGILANTIKVAAGKNKLTKVAQLYLLSRAYPGFSRNGHSADADRR